MSNLYAVTLNGEIIHICSTFRDGDGLAIFSIREVADRYSEYMQKTFELKYKVVEIECKEVKRKE